MLCHTLSSGDCLFLRYRATLHAARLTDPHIGAWPRSVSSYVRRCPRISLHSDWRMRTFAERFVKGKSAQASNYCSLLFGLNMTSSASHGQTSLRTYLYITLPCRKSRLRAAKLEFGKSSCLGLAFVKWPETKVLNLSPPFLALWDSTHIESDKANCLNPDGSSSCRTVIPATCSLGASYTRYYLDLDNA